MSENLAYGGTLRVGWRVMKYLLSDAQSRVVDAVCSSEYKMPSLLLMENASRSAADIIRRILSSDGASLRKRLVILCGNGNNGGDGFAMARHLHEDYDVMIIRTSKESPATEDAHTNLEICASLGLPFIYADSMNDESDEELYNHLHQADCIIDTLIGLGASQTVVKFDGQHFVEPQSRPKPLSSLYRHIVSLANSATCLRIAIDVPTGLPNAVTADDVVFHAHHTITMVSMKTSLLSSPNFEKCGELHVASIGAPLELIERISTSRQLDDHDVASIIPKRAVRSTKFDYGRVCIIAGSHSMPGAAALASNATLRSGAGLVELCTTLVHAALLPEIMPTVVDATEQGTIASSALDSLLLSCERADTILLGCGLGSNQETQRVCIEIITKFATKKHIVVDADALGALPHCGVVPKSVIATPHAGELRRMLKENLLISSGQRFDFQQSLELARTLSQMYGYTIVLKQFPVVTLNGYEEYWCTEGNPGMATAGSGDVLAGIVAALQYRCSNPLLAAAAAVHLHARSGNAACKTVGEESLTASSIIENLHEAFLAVEKHR